MLGLGETARRSAAGHARPARSPRRHPDARPVPAAFTQTSADRPLCSAGRVRRIPPRRNGNGFRARRSRTAGAQFVSRGRFACRWHRNNRLLHRVCRLRERKRRRRRPASRPPLCRTPQKPPSNFTPFSTGCRKAETCTIIYRAPSTPKAFSAPPPMTVCASTRKRMALVQPATLSRMRARPESRRRRADRQHTRERPDRCFLHA